jgi:hypothetical protein
VIDQVENWMHYGLVWFMILAYLTKFLVTLNSLTLVWFVANLLAVYETSYCVFTDSSHNFDKPLAAKSCAKKLASQFWQG